MVKGCAHLCKKKKRFTEKVYRKKNSSSISDGVIVKKHCVGASMKLHRGELYICTNLKNIIAKHIKLP